MELQSWKNYELRRSKTENFFDIRKMVSFLIEADAKKGNRLLHL